MNLGVAGKRAIVCGASKGLGRACAEALALEGVNVTICARSEDAVRTAAREIEGLSSQATNAVACDIATEAGRAAVLAACPAPDILINNAGGPPPGDFRDWGRDEWIKALDANMLAAIFMIKATLDGMIERGFGRIVNITSGTVKAPTGILGLSNGARAGLTGFVAGVARDKRVAGRDVTINNLLPGAFATDRLIRLFDEATLQRRMATIPAQRFGIPAEFGQLCAYLCSAQAGYITGQNVLIDGGAYPGTL
jgi:3-oxoacyl-[acyl-carrier protein] reductase